MRIEEEIKLDYSDVLFRPKRSTLTSRKEVDLNSKPLWFHSKSSLIFWKNQANNYAHVFNSIVNDPATLPPIVPNPIDNLIFDVITEETDFSSRLYLDKRAEGARLI